MPPGWGSQRLALVSLLLAAPFVDAQCAVPALLPTCACSGATLNCASLGLTTIPVGAFNAGLSNLTHLYLDSNPLTSLPAGVFEDLSSLKYLGMRFTQLASLPPGVLLP